MVYYKGFTIYSLGLKRYKVQCGKSLGVIDTYSGGLAEVLKTIDEVDEWLTGVFHVNE